MNPTPFKKVLQSLPGHVCGTHFLIAFLKLLRDSKEFILSGTLGRGRIHFLSL